MVEHRNGHKPWVVVVYHDYGGKRFPFVCDDIHADFRRIIQIIKPDLVMMMEAYFDESGTHAGSPSMCIAGYLFAADQVLHLDREWSEVLSDYGIQFLPYCGLRSQALVNFREAFS